jgi:hypothetical protein
VGEGHSLLPLRHTTSCAAQEASVGLRCFPELGGDAPLFRPVTADGTAIFASAFKCANGSLSRVWKTSID